VPNLRGQSLTCHDGAVAPQRLRDDRLWARVCVSALLVAAGVLLWRGLVTLPHRYDDLSARGVPVRLQVIRCGTGVGGDSRGYGCRVRLDYGAYTTTWKEGDVRPMTSPDGTLGGVVDPRDPGVHATAYELAHRSGAGPRGTEVFMAFVSLLLAVAVALVSAAARPRGHRQE
jgi:hypothetical protein